MDLSIKQTIGLHIQTYRESAGLTRKELGKRVGISSGSISRIERGITFPSLENLIRILNVLDVPADDIFYDVIQSSYLVKASLLEQKLNDLAKEERDQILLVLETLINHALD